MPGEEGEGMPVSAKDKGIGGNIKEGETPVVEKKFQNKEPRIIKGESGKASEVDRGYGFLVQEEVKSMRKAGFSESDIAEMNETQRKYGTPEEQKKVQDNLLKWEEFYNGLSKDAQGALEDVFKSGDPKYIGAMMSVFIERGIDSKVLQTGLNAYQEHFKSESKESFESQVKQ